MASPEMLMHLYCAPASLVFPVQTFTLYSDLRSWLLIGCSIGARAQLLVSSNIYAAFIKPEF